MIEERLSLGGIRALVAVPEEGDVLLTEAVAGVVDGAWEPCIRGRRDMGVRLWCLSRVFLGDGRGIGAPALTELGWATLGILCRVLAGAGRRAILFSDACVLADSGRALVLGGGMYAEAAEAAIALSERAVLAPAPSREPQLVSALPTVPPSPPPDRGEWAGILHDLEPLLPRAVLAERPWGYLALYPRNLTVSPEGAFAMYGLGAAILVSEEPVRTYAQAVAFLYAMPETPAPRDWYTSPEVLGALMEEAERRAITRQLLEFARKNKSI